MIRPIWKTVMMVSYFDRPVINTYSSGLGAIQTHFIDNHPEFVTVDEISKYCSAVDVKLNGLIGTGDYSSISLLRTVTSGEPYGYSQNTNFGT